ncbi:zinc finger protein 227-like [Chrysoperla carnea]|uniref:zinc finger protein 227-like n=1 Tax=Chrysoperla carnea TaxID=189513 RepID=UPI001D0871B0|nr:zinc finger protein 227-like [Chrysoperla carnea]
MAAKSNPPESSTYSGDFHYQIWGDKRKRCRVCHRLNKRKATYYHCASCKDMFGRNIGLYYYMTDSNNAPYICPCSKAYKYKRNLLAHQKYSCGGRGLNKNFKYITYEFTVEPERTRPFVCSYCQKSYKYERNVRFHQKYECGPMGEKKHFQCPFCEYKGKRKFVLHRHLLLRHKYLIMQVFVQIVGKCIDIKAHYSDIKRFFCKICGKNYKHESSLWRHEKLECQLEPQFQCSLCPYKSHQKSNLKNHLRRRHNYFINTMQICYTCGKNYRHQRSLSRHQKYECGTDRKFHCPYCDYKGKRKTTTMQRMWKILPTCLLLISSCETFYMCNICGKCYRHRRSFSRHQKYECQKEPGFQCPLCPYKGHQKSNMEAHIRRRHRFKNDYLFENAYKF